MDACLLNRLAAEGRLNWISGVIRSVMPRPGNGIMLRFEKRSRPALEFAPGPPRPRLAAASQRLPAGSGPPPHVLARLSTDLPGQIVAGVQVLHGDRVVRIDLEEAGTLVLEAFGPAANAYYLDAQGRVLACFRRRGRPGGRLAEGDRWRPPGQAPGIFPGDSGENPWRVPEGGRPQRPGLASPAPAPDPLEPVGTGRLIVRPDGPEDEDPVFTPTQLLGDAFLAREALLERHERALGRRRNLEHLLKRQETHLRRLQRAVEEESRLATRHRDLRHQAEAILAGLSAARQVGNRLILPDPRASDGPLLEIAIDPVLSPQKNAARLFKEAARRERSREHVAAKQRRTSGRLQELERLALRLAAARTDAQVQAIEEELPDWLRKASRQGKPPVHGGWRSSAAPVRNGRRREREEDPRRRRIRRFHLSEEWQVLVGRNGGVNDFLTFRVASALDFWLHAADYPGAHVVLRNPTRRPEPPLPILRKAASLAAFFSKAPRGMPAAIRWTQVRHVRKGRGLPPGAVLLPRFATLSARPVLPRGDRDGMP
ncbi:MAG: NFACT RNA binding domain-containing protein [Acidobacteriota bacterium]